MPFDLGRERPDGRAIDALGVVCVLADACVGVVVAEFPQLAVVDVLACLALVEAFVEHAELGIGIAAEVLVGAATGFGSAVGVADAFETDLAVGTADLLPRLSAQDARRIALGRAVVAFQALFVLVAALFFVTTALAIFAYAVASSDGVTNQAFVTALSVARRFRFFFGSAVFSPFSAHNAIWDLYIPGHSPFRF